MKQKFLMLLAAVLLGSASAFAQSGNNEPLKGDVNGDGTVTTYDYYFGVATEAQVQDQSYINGLSYNKSGIKPTSINFEEGFNVLIVPESWGVPIVKDPNGFEYTAFGLDELGISNPTGKLVLVYSSGPIAVSITWNQQAPLYWFSYGQTPITADNYTTANNAQQVTEYPSELIYNVPTRSYVYVLVASDKAVEFIEPTLNAPIDASIQTDINIPGYNVYKSDIKLSGNTKLRIKDNDYYFGVATEAQVQDQSYINGLSYNKSGVKPTEFTLQTGYNVFIYPEQWGTPNITDDNGFGFTPYTADDLGVTLSDSTKEYIVIEASYEGTHANVAWKSPTSLDWFSYGQTPITTDAPAYNLQGQRVQEAKKGLYIVNGKKTVMK